MTTPALDAAIQAVADYLDSPDLRPLTARSLAHSVVHVALRSLATPTPEVIEAMAARSLFPVAKSDDEALDLFRDMPQNTRTGIMQSQQAAHAAEWALILGETK